MVERSCDIITLTAVLSIIHSMISHSNAFIKLYPKLEHEMSNLSDIYTSERIYFHIYISLSFGLQMNLKNVNIVSLSVISM